MSKTARNLDSHIEDLPEGSFRRDVLESARRFKASWVEFGRLLTRVKREGLWSEWGHASFDAYCTKELFIRKQTAEKLTMSYGFLERHEPELVREPRERSGDAGRAPPFEVIEVLSRAEAAGRIDDSKWTELREEVLEAPSAAAVNRQLADRYGPAPKPPPASDDERLARLVSLARKLAQGCAAEKEIPRDVVDRAKELLADLEEVADG
ncbi:MAG TPA: hypothetical protein VFK85_08590 [Anaeromyxobacteraceae bacterium]|nr:hypothetical protein [Anaeromyxobacteraceae bacterium]